MNRKIKFRGRIKSGKWIYGDLVHIEDRCYIFDHGCNVDSYDRYEVDKDTVGEFIGISDHDASELYEGDIVAMDYNICGNHFPLLYKVIHGEYSLKLISNNKILTQISSVIGNIYDNKDLLK